MPIYVHLVTLALLATIICVLFWYIRNCQIENQNNYVLDVVGKYISSVTQAVDNSISINNKTNTKIDELQKSVIINCTSIMEAQTQLKKDMETLGNSLLSIIDSTSKQTVDNISQSKNQIISSIHSTNEKVLEAQNNITKTNEVMLHRIDELSKILDTLNSDLKRRTEESLKANRADLEKVKDIIADKIEECIVDNGKKNELVMAGLRDNGKVISESIVEIKNNNNICNNVVSKIENVSTSITDVQNIICKRIEIINTLVLHSQNEEKGMLSEIKLLQNLVKVLHSGSNANEASTNTQEKTKSEPKDWVDRIKDPETNNIVENYYLNNELKKSTMKNSRGVIIYEIEYDSMNIVKSKNYDETGAPTIEQTYYHNGQVSSRYEYATRKKTTFDINGNKS